MSTTTVETEHMRLGALVALNSSSAMQHLPLVLHRDSHSQVSWNTYRHVDFHSLYITESGQGQHVIDTTTYATARGDVYVMGAGSVHTFTNCERLVLHAIHFSTAIFRDPTWEELAVVPGFNTLVIDHPASRRLHLDPAAYAEVARDLAELWSEWKNGTTPDALRVRALFLRLLLRLARLAAGERPPALHRANASPVQADIVATAVRTIDLNYGHNLRVADLAASVYLSPDRFSELFSAVMGRTPRDYIGHVRLEHAKTLLATTAMPIAEIARTTGFRHQRNFTARFRGETGLSPRDYRRSAQA